MDHRSLLRAMFDAATRAAHPDHILSAWLPASPSGRLIVLAAGKGAAAMAAAAERYYLDGGGFDPARLRGLATTRYGHGVATRRIAVIEAGHPVPDQAGANAATQTLTLARQAGADDLVLVLLSGGGSANWVAPVAGITLGEKRALTGALLRCGAPISAINTVRKHLSRIKGGHLARAAMPAPLLTLAISDVPQDDRSVIASGPTTPDLTTLADARQVLTHYGIAAGAAIVQALEAADNETPKPGDAAFRNARFEIIATPRDAVRGALDLARIHGYETVDLGHDLEGEAREVAKAHAALALQARAQRRKLAIVSGGELTVTVRGAGRGGPNQEYALALLQYIRDLSGISALAADTDGADGGSGAITDPAGAIVDAGTVSRAMALGLDPADYLARNDATGFFKATGDLLVTGPTLTNVNDLRVILVESVST